MTLLPLLSFKKTLADYHNRANEALLQAISSPKNTPVLLREAMHYATMNGGKRLRPILVYATGHCFGQPCDTLDVAAAAIECIHCYSLIHDDLPAMDDDKLRRKKPTCHIVYGEALAILAGDALQTLAFDLLSSQKNSLVSPEIQLKMIQVLATHSGASGMIGGQSLDLLAEGKAIAADDLLHIHRLKTAALIRASVTLGALAAGCNNTEILEALDQFALRLGLAFQLQDDVLDIAGNSKKLGKKTGQDIKQNKATYAILFGIEKTQQHIQVLMQEAIAILDALPHDTVFLKQLCDALLTREM